MSGMGGAGRIPSVPMWARPMVGAPDGLWPLGMLNDGMRQSAAFGMQQQQMCLQGGPWPRDQTIGIFRTPPPVKKPTVCAYCGGPDYTERKCPGCGAREKHVQA